MANRIEFGDGVYAVLGNEEVVVPNIGPEVNVRDYLASLPRAGWQQLVAEGDDDLDVEEEEYEDGQLAVRPVAVHVAGAGRAAPRRFELPVEQEVGCWTAVKLSFLDFFGCKDVAEEWRHELDWDREVSREMRTARNETNAETEAAAVQAVVEANGERVGHVPRLVVDVVVALRMKLGMGAMDRSVAGNVAVVRAEAAKMLREWNVRHKDAAAHLLVIERCFFEDDSHYRITTWRARARRRSKFVRAIIGGSDPPGFDY